MTYAVTDRTSEIAWSLILDIEVKLLKLLRIDNEAVRLEDKVTGLAEQLIVGSGWDEMWATTKTTSRGPSNLRKR